MPPRINSKKLVRLISTRLTTPGTAFKIGDLVESIQRRHPEYSRSTIYTYCTMLSTTGYLCRLEAGQYGILQNITISDTTLRTKSASLYRDKHRIVHPETISATLSSARVLLNTQGLRDTQPLLWGSTAEWYGVWDLENKRAVLLGKIVDLGVTTPTGTTLSSLWLTIPLPTGTPSQDA